MENIENEKEEVKKTEARPNRGLLILAGVGIGCGLYGFVKGRQVGYLTGAKDGIIYTTEQINKAIYVIAEERKLAKGD